MGELSAFLFNDEVVSDEVDDVCSVSSAEVDALNDTEVYYVPEWLFDESQLPDECDSLTESDEYSEAESVDTSSSSSVDSSSSVGYSSSSSLASEAPTTYNLCGLTVPIASIDRPTHETVMHSVPAVTISPWDVLRMRIPYVAGLMDSVWSESQTDEIDFSRSGFEGASIEALFDYAYSGQLNICTEHAKDLTMAADYLGMESVVSECAHFLFIRIDYKECFSLMQLFHSINYRELDKILSHFIDLNFVPISYTQEFINLPVTDLILLLKRDSLHVDGEEQVFDAVDRWMRNGEERRTHATKLIKYIRLLRLPKCFLAKRVRKALWIVDNPDCVCMLREAENEMKVYYVPEWLFDQSQLPDGCDPLTESDDHSELVDARLTDRNCNDSLQLIVFMGARYGDNDKRVCIYDPIRGSYTSGSMESGPREFAIPVVVDHRTVYFCENYTVKYDARMNTWKTVEKYGKEGGVFPAMGIIGDRIYSIGGDFDTCLDWGLYMTVHDKGWYAMYGPEGGNGYSIMEMKSARCRAASCVHEGKLYVIGGVGWNGDRQRHQVQTQTYRHVEYYNPSIQRFTCVADMPKARHSAAAVSYKGFIFVVGGMGAVLVVSCGRLFVVGGDDGRFWKGEILEFPPLANQVKTVEEYVDDRNEWIKREVIPGDFSHVFALPMSATVPTPPHI